MPNKNKTVLVLLLFSALLLCGCTRPWEGSVKVSASAQESVSLKDDEERESALNGLFFFGESTTAHLARKGGVMDTPRRRRQVWRDDSGTRRLDLRTAHSPVSYLDENVSSSTLSFADAVERERPPILVLSFGLNGLEGFIKNPDSFARAYHALIREIHARSPETRILLQSVYPVGENRSFSKDVQTVNAHIQELNGQIREIAGQYEAVRYADTASVLRDAEGRLLPEYDSGDGIHLTNQAYLRILDYLTACVHS